MDDVARQPHGELAAPIARATGLQGTGYSTGYSAGTQRYSTFLCGGPKVLSGVRTLTGESVQSLTTHVVSQKVRASKAVRQRLRFPWRTPPARRKQVGVCGISGFRGSRGSNYQSCRGSILGYGSTEGAGGRGDFRPTAPAPAHLARVPLHRYRRRCRVRLMDWHQYGAVTSKPLAP